MARFLEGLVSIPRALGGDLAVGPVLEEALSRLIGAAELTGAAVQVLDQADEKLHHVLSRGQGESVFPVLVETEAGRALCSRVAATGRPLHFSAVPAGEPALAGFTSLGLEAVSLTPIVAGGGVMGVLVAAGPAGSLDDETAAFVEAVGAQLGVVLENAGLLAEVLAAGEEWAATFDAIKDLIAVFDSDGRLVRANRALVETLALSPDDLAAIDGHRLLGGALCGCDGETCLLDEALAAGRTRTKELTSPELGGRFLVTVSALPGRGAVLIARDVSPIQELEAARAEAKRFEETNRFKNDFVATVSHQFRTPLHQIISTAEMLAEGLFEALTPGQDEAVGHILSAGRRLLAMVNDLLDLNKLEAGKLVLETGPFSMAEAVRQVIETARQRAEEKRVELVLADGFADGRLTADRRRIKQALTALVNQALDRTAAGGRVILDAETTEGKLMVSVSGPSPDPGDEEHALSLTLARRLVELHGGRLDLEPGPDGRGSRAVLELPLEE